MAIRDLTNELAAELGIGRELSDSFGSGVTKAREIERDIAAQFGIISLDKLLGDGLGSGLVEVFGPDSVGKTALVGRLMAHTQDVGADVYLAQTDFFDKPYLSGLGVDLRKLNLIRGYGDAMADKLVEVASRPTPTLLVVDSLTMLRPNDEESLDGWNDFALELLDELRTKVRVGNVVVATSQIRFKKRSSPWSDKVESASRRMTDMFTVRLELTRTEGSDTRYPLGVDILRNTLAPAARFLEIEVEKGAGVRWDMDAVKVGLRQGVLKRNGNSGNIFLGTTFLGRSLEVAAGLVRGRRGLYERIAAGVFA